ncbi:MAG: DUF262 domain-containing protein [Campylobacterota bacterium]|nr:DUF262 domain-containing protein [Campylobacterota bacterium]
MNNFKDLIEKYYIQIPIIQRDYAQGRQDTDVIEIRNTFLKVISSKLNENEVLHLDFIYGSIKNGNYFIPLDGQQRLTTLYLLYFYFGKKEEKNVDFLLKFTYETRASSREFCNKLVQHNINFTEDTLSKQIKNSHWFLPYWDNDPTIKSIFTMIDSIHQEFSNKNYFEKLNKITFEFFELEKFGLDDDLYIKMNARGKPLTPFENFKANFEQHLEIVDITLKNEFSRKIDKEWIDIFWNFKDKFFLIDEAFMNYFYFISEMLYIKSNKVVKELSKADVKTKLNEIYATKENIEFLFHSIDNLPIVFDSFDSIFSTYEYTENLVTLFDKDINLTNKIITKSPISLEQKIILFIIIDYFEKNKNLNDYLINLIRVLRNLLGRIRGLKQSQFYYTQSLRYENLHKLINLFSSLVDKDIYSELLINNLDITGTSISKLSLNQEKTKAKLINENSSFKSLIFKLEDFKYLKGDIDNFLINDYMKFELYVNSVIDIYTNNSDTSIIQAMLTSGDHRIWRGWAGGHSKYYFGKTGYWEIILTSDKKDYFKKFLDDYEKNNADLNRMKNSFLSTCNKKDWKYYFVKYDEILNTEDQLSKDNNTFAWYDDYSLEKMGGTNLNAYHLNPFVRTIAIKSNISYSVYKWDGYSMLKIHAKIKELYSINDGWKLEFSNSIDEVLKNSLVSKYNLINSYLNVFTFKVANKDRIEQMLTFIKDLKEEC